MISEKAQRTANVHTTAGRSPDTTVMLAKKLGATLYIDSKSTNAT
jgi:hypothetical protein